ncbi:baseplate J/gp47 family protein [Georgenia muralis]
MSTYRSRLEAGVHPGTDPRRAPELRAELRRLAAALTPRWRPTGERDDVGSALLRIGARLAEETTQRLDATARRDALAFFDLLGLPPAPPRPATGVLVLTLGAKQLGAVHAPARTQVAVTPPAADVAPAGAAAGARPAPAGDDVTFETQARLRVVPGRVGELVVVDAGADRIELAPARVTTPSAPVAAAGRYRLLTFAGAQSRTVQLSPAGGLAPEDLLRIGTGAYRVLDADEHGLVTLLDPLEEPAPAGTTAERITALESFRLRDVQAHVLHLGHPDLLNLDQPATIGVTLAPPGLARELGALDVAWTIFGSRDGEEEPAWHPLDLLGVRGAQVRLAKSWTGSVEETEVHGRTSRWLRAELRAPVAGPPPTSRASGVHLSVASAGPGEDAGTGTGGGTATGAGGGTGTGGGAGTGTGGGATPAEGSRTVTAAAHNGTPLATTRRFLPFGPEPLRFDIFALAAPETLSKKGATARLDITLVDSSIVAFALATGSGTVWRGYGAGRNGNLQVLAPQDGGVRWLEAPLTAADGRRVLLGAAAPVAVGRTDAAGDVVVVTDRDGALWSAVVRTTSTTVTVDGSTWHPLDRPGGQGDTAGDDGAVAAAPVVVPAPAGVGAAVVLEIVGGDLHALRLDEAGRAVGTWSVVEPDGPAGLRLLTGVQGADWPDRPDRVEVLAADDDGALRVATIGDGAAGPTASWTEVAGEEPVPPARPDVVPAATRYRTGGAEHLWVCLAAGGGLVGTDRDGEDLTVLPIAAAVADGSALHAHPGVLGVGGLPTTAGLGPDEAFVWQGGEGVRTTPLPAPASATRPQLAATDDALELLVPGAGERVLRAAVAAPVELDVELHDLIELESPWVPNRAEITPSDGSAPSFLTLGSANRRIVEGDVRVYEVDGVTAGTTVRFLRVSPTLNTGEFDPPDSRTLLRLAATDSVTAEGSRIVVGEASHVVTDLTGGVATLDPEVAGDDPEYQVVEETAVVAVTDEELGTLAKVVTTVKPLELVFGAPAEPRTQQVLLAERVLGVVWARLGAAWETLPTAGTTAASFAEEHTWSVSVRERGYTNPELSWEYADGDGWRRLEVLDGTDDLSTSGTIRFVVPADLTTTEIGGQEDYWIRARLVGGDYGRPSYLVRQETSGGVTEQTVVVDTSELRPPEILAIEATFASPPGLPPEVLLVENNADVVDQTQAAAVTSASFELFEGAGAVGAESRALFAGLTVAIGRGPLTLFVDAVDQPGTGALEVDVRTPEGWRRVPADDRTASLRRTGTLTLALDHDPVPVRLFGRDRVWLRLRPGADPGDGPDGGPAAGTGSGSGAAAAASWAPVVRLLLPNAVPVSQARTVQHEILGSSLGAPGTTVFLADIPVLPDTLELRVREDLGQEEVAALAAQARGVGPTPVVTGVERTPGTWVLWRRVDSLVGQRGDARVYVLEPATGRVRFGDDRTGRIPRAGRDNIRAFGYQQGGGAAGNTPPWPATRLTTAVQGVEAAVLPLGTAGGVDTPPADSLFATAPQQLRHAGRALTPADVEALAVASSGDVLRARCRRPHGPGEPVRVAIAVRGTGCPHPTFAQLDAVAARLREIGWGALGGDGVEVTGPTDVPVTVAVTLGAPPERWAAVEQDAAAALTALFDPITGGPDGTGWPFGRRPTTADVLRALAPVAGVERVVEVSVDVPDAFPVDGLACAQDLSVVVTGGAP